MSPAQPQEKKSPNLWLALVPGILVLVGATGMFFYSKLQFLRASDAITAPDPKDDLAASRPAASELEACVETYGVTMHTSESYVSESYRYARTRPKNAPNEISTVLRGMVRNNCGRPLRRVEIYLEVRDAEGKRGASWVSVGRLDHGQADTFEKAWIGRVTEYKVTKVR